jgi:hypothetical protein
MNHLHESIRLYLQKSDEERIMQIQNDRWIGYTQATKVLNKLEDLLKHPRIIRMPNLGIYGLTNNGKTNIVYRFFSKHKPIINENGDGIFAPVFYVQVPPKPDEKRFYNNILDKLSTPYKFYDRVDKKQQQVITHLSKINNKILILDEIHHVLAGTMTAQRSFLNVIKYLSNELQIVIVVVGTHDALTVINTDPQLANRFEPIVLPTWTNDEEYEKLLVSFECMLPLRNPSNLTDEKLALKILSMSEGTIGEISEVLKRAAILSIKNKSEKITSKTLDQIDYISPSQRKMKR